jgi:general secretion pathway protein D
MKALSYISVLLVCLMCAASEKPSARLPEEDAEQAQRSFEHAIDLQKHGRTEEALEQASQAASLSPENIEYATARELLRGQLAALYIERGNLLAEGGDTKHAVGQFQAALAVDPQNGYAQERLHDVSPPADPEREHVLQLLASVDEVDVSPKPGRQDFHIKGDTRSLYDAIGKTFGVTMTYDQALQMKRVQLNVEQVDFNTAMMLAGKLTHTFWSPLSDKLAIVADDTQELRRQYDRMSLQTFFVSNVVAPTDLNDLVNVMRTIFDVKLVSLEPGKNVITLRAPKRQLEIIRSMMDGLMDARPEVLIDIRAYEINYAKSKQYGLNLNGNFTIFNVFSEIRNALGDAAGPILDQFRKTGALDPSQIPSTALGGLQGSPLLQPFIFFGGGLGLTGVTVSPIGGRLSFSNSLVKTLEHVTVRASSGSPASMQIGTRFPIETSSFNNITISNSGSPVTSSTIPSFQYEDLGVILKTTPHINTGDTLSMEMDLEIKNLGSQSFNGIPVITHRAYTGTITVKDGEPSVIAGTVEEQTDRTKSGYPGIGQIPILGNIFDTNSNDRTKNEILIVVTPHIIRKPFHNMGVDPLWTLPQ